MRYGIVYICGITKNQEVVNWEDLSNRTSEQCLDSIKDEYPNLVEVVDLVKPYNTIYKS